MLVNVHGKQKRICQWTGESIYNAFKIPLPSKLRTPHGKTWVGCYSAPSCCLAAMLHLRNTSWNPVVTQEEWEHLMNEFQSSLIRNEAHKTEKPDFKIEAANSFETLSEFGGNLSLAEFKAVYNHDFQVKAYEQIIPKDIMTEELDEAKVAKALNSPKPWFLTRVGMDSTKDEGLPNPEELEVPRCAGAFVDWLQALVQDLEGSEWTSVVLYFDEGDKKKFGISNLSDALSWSVNKTASLVMNRKTTPVYGNVSIVHKNTALKINKHRRKPMPKVAELPSSTEPMQTDAVEAPQPEPVVEKAIKSVKLVIEPPKKKPKTKIALSEIAEPEIKKKKF